MTDFARSPDGTKIAYEIVGDGKPLLLIHGFGSSRRINWRSTGWLDALTRAGRRIVAMDCRGHGESDKPHDVHDYDETRMMEDAVAVLDAADVAAGDVMGYSMGGYISLRLLHRAPQRVRRLVLGGVGGHYFDYWAGRSETVAEGLLAPDASKITEPTARLFRSFAEKGGNDLVALAACMRRERRIYSCKELGAFQQAVLVVCGENDDIGGPADAIAQCFRHGRAVVVPKRDHMLTVGDKAYKEAAVAFLGG